MSKAKVDFLIVGGGVIGLATARRLSAIYPKCSIRILEKEPALGVHTSGRNSGVLHAGFYYASDSMKAKYSVRGNKMWRDYCNAYNVPIKRTGKMVVMPKGQSDESRADQADHLRFLYEQGLVNGVELEMIPIEEARKQEPMVTGEDKTEVLWSPNTAVVDIHKCLAQIKSGLEDSNPNFQLDYGTSFQSSIKDEKAIVTSSGEIIEYGHMINSGGLKAFEIANHYGAAQNLEIFPMKGLYCMSKFPLDHIYNTIVYPVPLRGTYTLGVHSTMTPDGHMKIGPTTSPAFSLEMYQGFQNFRASELLNIVKSYGLILRSQQRGLIWEYITRDLPKHSIKVLIDDISRIHKMDISDFHNHFYTRPGIRAQLVDSQKRMLINDFLLRRQHVGAEKKEADILHLLNISSPGWTSAFPFANKIVSELMGLDEDELLASDSI